MQVRDLRALFEVLFHRGLEPVVDRIDERQVSGPAGAGVDRVGLAVGFKHLGVIRRRLVAVVNEVLLLETEIKDVLHHEAVEGVAEALTVGKRRDVALVVRPFVHHIELDVPAVDVELVQEIGDFPIGRVRVRHDHDALLVIPVGILDTHDHIRHDRVLELVRFKDVDLDVRIERVLSLHGHDILERDLADTVDLGLVLERIKLCRFEAEGFISVD